jgi:hypothetical protein
MPKYTGLLGYRLVCSDHAELFDGVWWAGRGKRRSKRQVRQYKYIDL